MFPNQFSRFAQFFHAPDPIGGGSAAPAGNPDPSTSSANPGPASTATPAAAGGAGGPSGTPSGTPSGQPTGTPAGDGVDRRDWIPPYRFNEVTQRLQTLQSQFEQQQQRTRQFLGMEPQEDPQAAALRTAIVQLFPQLGALVKNPKAFERVMSMAENGGFDELSGTSNAMWARHANDMVSHGVSQLATAMGKDAKSMGTVALQRVSNELRSFIAADPSGERLRRYEAGDKSVVDECITEVTGFYVQPVQVQQAFGAAGQVQRARSLPSSGPRTGTPPPQGASGPRVFATKRERFAAMREAALASGQ